MILRSLYIILLLVWALFLTWLLTFGSGDLVRLLHPRLWWILWVALVVLVLFSVSLATSRNSGETRKSLFLELPGICILVIPVVYFFIAKDARLDGASLENRLVQGTDGFFLNNLPGIGNLDDSTSPDMLFSKVLREPDEYTDQDVEVVCQSFVHDELPENYAMCYRYLITCCAADALPAFIFLEHGPELQIESDRWVKVSGPVSIINNNDMEFPAVKVEKITYVEEPAFPWAM